MNSHEVLIAGGGPVGMVLAAELALAEVDVAIIERRPDHNLVGSRAGGLLTRTIEVLDQRGVADRFLAEGQTHEAMPFGNTMLDIGDQPTRHPYFLAIFQNQIERIMADWISELPVRVYYGSEVTGFTQDETGVEVQLAAGEALRGSYLVGCDGGRSLIRKAAGIEFPGWEATKSNLIAEVEFAEEAEEGMRHDELGIHAISKMADRETFRVVVTEQKLNTGSEPTMGELSEALVSAFGSDFGVRNPSWLSRFTDTTRQAATYRADRVLLAGDAAHIHYPAGGQGLNLGAQDSVNLGWKLAQVVKGISPSSLLDTYEAERHPLVARILQHTMALSTLQGRDARMIAVVDLISKLAATDEARRIVIGISSGLDIQYDLGEGHPLLGRRMPDLDLLTADGPRRVFELLHGARPILLNLGEPGNLDVGPWVERVQLVDASHEGEWELPVIGVVSAPAAALIRPDGYVAWVGEGTDEGLATALATWFGTPETA